MATHGTATDDPDAFTPVPGAHRAFDAACRRLLALQDEQGAWEGRWSGAP
ncbi:hypothetical protein ACFQ2B_35845 [Streptomyces stramineus]